MKLKIREVALSLVLCLAILGAFVASNSTANAALGVAGTCGITGCVSTPVLSSSTSYSYSGTTTGFVTTTSTSMSTSYSSSTTTTTATSVTTSWSYTSTISTTVTSTSWTTTYTGTSGTTNTVISTVSTTASTTTTYINVATQKGTQVPACPIAYVTGGSYLEPYANFLRNFRSDVQNTTAGREFLLTFNSWYYSWAPSLSYSAANNPWLFKALQVGVYPLIGILYASYYAYNIAAPLSTEAGAITAGITAATLLGAVYIAPVSYVAVRILRRHRRILISRQVATSSTVWFAASTLVCIAAYVAGSGPMLAFATSSIVLSMLSLGSVIGERVLAYAQVPFTNAASTVLAFRRLTKIQF